MRNFEVDYETTVPPWHTGHEKIEAENLDTVRAKFNSKHEAARIYKVTEVLYDQRIDELSTWRPPSRHLPLRDNKV